MTHEKANFDILARIEEERKKRGWSEYTLAKNAGVTQSTISTWTRKNIQPSVASIEKICDAFGITLSQFFQDDTESEIAQTQKELFREWTRLTPAQRESVLGLLRKI